MKRAWTKLQYPLISHQVSVSIAYQIRNNIMHGYNSKCRDFPLLILNTFVMILLSSWKIEQTAPNVSSTGSKGKWGQETNSFRHSSCFQLEKVVIFLSPAVRKVNLPLPSLFQNNYLFLWETMLFSFFWPALIFNSSCESDLCHGNFALMLLGKCMSNSWCTKAVGMQAPEDSFAWRLLLLHRQKILLNQKVKNLGGKFWSQGNKWELYDWFQQN